MADAIFCHQVATIGVNATRNVTVDFTPQLDELSNELLSGTPTVVEVTTTDLTLGSKTVNTTVKTVLGESVKVGGAVQFTVTGGTVDIEYEINIRVGTTSTPAQTLEARLRLRFK